MRRNPMDSLMTMDLNSFGSTMPVFNMVTVLQALTTESVVTKFEKARYSLLESLHHLEETLPETEQEDDLLYKIGPKSLFSSRNGHSAPGIISMDWICGKVFKWSSSMTVKGTDLNKHLDMHSK